MLLMAILCASLYFAVGCLFVFNVYLVLTDATTIEILGSKINSNDSRIVLSRVYKLFKF